MLYLSALFFCFININFLLINEELLIAFALLLLFCFLYYFLKSYLKLNYINKIAVFFFNISYLISSNQFFNDLLRLFIKSGDLIFEFMINFYSSSYIFIFKKIFFFNPFALNMYFHYISLLFRFFIKFTSLNLLKLIK